VAADLLGPCELSPQHRPCLGISLSRGNPPHQQDPTNACASALAGGGYFADYMVPAYGAGTALEMDDLRCVIARAVRLIGILKIFVSKYQNQEIGEDSQARYAPLHLPDHVPYATNSAPQVRQRFPSRSLKPLPHTPKASTTLPRGLIKIGRSFPAIGLIFSGSIERQTTPRKAAIASCGP
jgi:hypothetical protein